MYLTSETAEQAAQPALPLTLPEEIWAGLSAAQREVYQTADAVVSVFAGEIDKLPTREIAAKLKLPAADVLAALQLLESMSLVSLWPGNLGPVVKLQALPDEHVRFVDLTGRVQWIFVARPLEPPNLGHLELN